MLRTQAPSMIGTSNPIHQFNFKRIRKLELNMLRE
jgi:hypothetical protein